MTPKQFIKYTRWLDKKGIAICDGTSANMHFSMFDILFPLFIISGMGVFLTILTYWDRFRNLIGLS